MSVRFIFSALVLCLCLIAVHGSVAAEKYPFEGEWVQQSNRCTNPQVFSRKGMVNKAVGDDKTRFLKIQKVKDGFYKIRAEIYDMTGDYPGDYSDPEGWFISNDSIEMIDKFTMRYTFEDGMKIIFRKCVNGKVQKTAGTSAPSFVNLKKLVEAMSKYCQRYGYGGRHECDCFGGAMSHEIEEEHHGVLWYVFNENHDGLTKEFMRIGLPEAESFQKNYDAAVGKVNDACHSRFPL